MEVIMKENGLMIKNMEKANLVFKMGQNTMENGSMIYKKGMGRNIGQTEVATKVNINKERNKGKEDLNGQTQVFMRVSL